MIKGSVLAKRVTKVLLNRLQGNTEELIKFLDFLKFINELYKKNQTFKDLVLNDEVPLEEKKKVFETLVESFGLTNKELALELLEYLTKHHAFRYLPLIIRSYQYELENVLKAAKAEIVSADTLDEEIKNRLIEVLKEKLGRTIEAEFRVDPSLIGGFVVKTTSVVVDASVKNLLRELAMKI
ncbi:MAG: ATP synthase F1 subunit delta [Aquificae bacterium]|jgi:F-type H+-transporting ATPase subunit delta|nr:ATP synthase F1 subunit delta [Aquificota bacterium]